MDALSVLQFTARRRLPIILQTEVAECGLACLAMVSSAYGHVVDLNTLRRQYPASLKGSTLKGLMITADKLRLGCRALRLEPYEMPQLRSPAILHWDMNHFVVLKKATKKWIIIHDPAMGERKVSIDEVSKHFTGVALEVAPVQGFEPKKEKITMKLSDFWQRIVGLKRSLFQLFFLSLVLQLVALASPFYMQLVLDEVVVSNAEDFLKVLAIGFFLLTLIEVGTQLLRSLVVLHLGNTFSFQMAVNVFRRMIRLPMGYFDKRHIGDIVSRFNSLHQIKELLTSTIVTVIVDGIMGIATLALMFYYSTLLGGVVAGALCLYALVRFVLYSPLKTRTEETIVSSAKENTNFMESVRAIQSIKLFGRENDRQNLWQNRYAEAINSGIRLGKFNIGFTTFNQFLFGVENVLVIYLGAQAVMETELSVGMLIAFMAYKRRFTDSAINFVEKAIELKMLDLHMNRLADIALTPEEDVNETETKQNELAGRIELDNIGFRYSPEEPYLFEGLSCVIPQGQSVALVGASGCGKTTLMKLMLGLIPPSDGEILADGMSLTKFGLKSFRQQIGVVMQDDQLLSGSISDNICFFDSDVNMEQIKHCARIAAIDEEIEAMPMGFDTLIGEMGSALSGGQKQRVLLARALYRNPKILMLDEATSHLDVKTEKRVNDALSNMEITRVIIAHRPNTIRSADRVIRLRDHQLSEVDL